MNDYPFYEVMDCNNFEDFLDSIEKRFSSRIAFQGRMEKWTYQEICETIRIILPMFEGYSNCIFGIKMKTPPLFCVTYFAIVLSGNIAYLLDDMQLGDTLEYTIIEEATILEYINKKKNSEINSCMTNCLDSNSFCTLIKSSGSTSVAKEVMLSQRNILSDTIAGMKMFEYSSESIYFKVLPYSHLFGLVADLLGPLYSGAIICYSQNELNFFGGLRFFRPTNLNLPPILAESIALMLEKHGDYNETTGGRLKKILCAGARVDDALNKIFECYGIRMYAAYGLTECSPCVTMNRDLYWKYGSVGKVLPCCKLKIVDGEIAVAGSNVMLGYFNDAIATKEVIKEGWLYTGDLGYIDRDGFLFIQGRRTNLIVFENGQKLVPESVEKLFDEVDGVEESMVIPWIKEKRTMLKIFIVTHNKEKCEVRMQINNICRERNILSKVTDIEYISYPLPRNKLGKLIRGNVKIP